MWYAYAFVSSNQVTQSATKAPGYTNFISSFLNYLQINTN